MNEDIWEALEASTVNRKAGKFSERTNASKREILNHRDLILRFLSELDGELSVEEIREALDEYS